MAPIDRTFFGILFYRYQTKCGCMNYMCNKNDCKTSPDLYKKKRYSEMFYLGNDYFGKFNYNFINCSKINSDITILHNNLNVCFRERLKTIDKIKYELYFNKIPIMYDDIPKDLIKLLSEKKLIVPPRN